MKVMENVENVVMFIHESDEECGECLFMKVMKNVENVVTFLCGCGAALDAGLVGLSITYSMTLMGMFQWGVRQSAEVENQVRDPLDNSNKVRGEDAGWLWVKCGQTFADGVTH